MFDVYRLICLIFSDIAENISCKTEFMKDTWSVFGHCDIYKTSSSHNRYRCTWIEINEVIKKHSDDLVDSGVSSQFFL